MTIIGKVATLLNEREIAINIGSNDGVEQGMVFSVRANYVVEINDPDTGELLDTLDKEKIRVRVREVKEKYSICSTYRTITRGRKGPADIINQTFTDAIRKYMDTSITVQRETLKNPLYDQGKPINPEESVVKVGDRVIQIEA